MALAVRIIPTLLYRGTTLVKGRQFRSWRSVGHVQQAARIHAMRGVDELCCLDIGATPDGRGPDFSLVEKLTEGNFTPITVGGGVRTVEDVKLLLRAGADKVSICSHAFHSNIVREASSAFGRQAIVGVIDYSRGRVWSSCGHQEWPMNPVSFARMIEDDGAGELILTSIAREGTMEGYDLDMIKAVSEAVSIPVIAHGGCGTYAHMLEAIKAGASAVAAGAMFQFSDNTPRGAAEYLAAKGIEVRL